MTEQRKHEHRVPEVLAMIDDCLRRFRAAVGDHPGLPDVVTRMLDAGLTFARESLQAIQEQLEKGRAAQAKILVRPLFEISVNFLWASREEGGWQRIQADAAHELTKWAEKAKSFDELRKSAAHILSDPKRNATAAEAKPLPDVLTMVRKIRDLDVAEGLVVAGCEPAHEASYYAVYALTSQTTHGTITALCSDPDASHGGYITAGAIYSAYLMVRAVHHVLGWDPKEVQDKAVTIMQASVDDLDN